MLVSSSFLLRPVKQFRCFCHIHFQSYIWLFIHITGSSFHFFCVRKQKLLYLFVCRWVITFSFNTKLELNDSTTIVKLVFLHYLTTGHLKLQFTRKFLWNWPNKTMFYETNVAMSSICNWIKRVVCNFRKLKTMPFFKVMIL